jgi:hypothetical protein
MVWREVAFRTLSNLAVTDDTNALNNPLLTEALLEGHVATQVLAIRKLMDDRRGDIISLRRLVKDLRHDFHLFTRENYVAMMDSHTTIKPFGRRRGCRSSGNKGASCGCRSMDRRLTGRLSWRTRSSMRLRASTRRSAVVMTAYLTGCLRQ